jgi:glycosyltransferase involved in cell wall biosynthesis
MSVRPSPILSVGLPVYNGLPYLAEALRSVRDAEFQDYELIVCDNASTDGTGEVVREFAREDPRIRYFRNSRNIGAVHNFNRTLELARGKYFRWLASDDLHSHGAIARCVEVLERDPSVFLAFPRTRVIDDAGNVTRDHDDGDGWSSSSPSERFGYSLFRWGLSNPMFGVMRSDVLRHAMVLGDHPASDLVMQSDLAIRGRFVRVSGEYYYRRIHAGCTDNLDPVALAQFYDPDRRSAFDNKALRLFRGLGRAVQLAPVTPGERRRMWILLARRAWNERAMLAREVRDTTWRTSRNKSRRLMTAHSVT